jgi:PE-PPE domain
MRSAAHAGLIAVLSVLGAITLVLASTITTAAAQAATTALIMGGSGLGDPTEINALGLHIPMPNYVPNVENYYIAPNSSCQPATCQLVPVITPEGLLPPIIGSITFDPSVAQGVTKLHTALQSQLNADPGGQVVIFGYSQSGDIITKTLRNFAADPTSAPSPQQVSFVVAGDTNRPNGGILSRFPGLYIPGLNTTFDGAAPTNTGYTTTDIAFEYDPVADFPQYPINVLADLNSLVGFLDVHATYPNPYLPLPPGIPFFPTALPDGYTPQQLQQAMNDPANRQTYGDTTYVTVPAINLPILQPFLDIGTDTGTSWAIKPLVDLIQPALRVLVDLGYDRNIPYGQPTPAGLFPTINPSTLATSLSAAVSEGIHDALADVGLASGAAHAPSVTAKPAAMSSAEVKTALPQVYRLAGTPSLSPASADPSSPVTSDTIQSARAHADRVTSALQKTTGPKGFTIDQPNSTSAAVSPSDNTALNATPKRTAASSPANHGAPAAPHIGKRGKTA